MNDEAFRQKAFFVRDEAKRYGRNPESIKFSNFIFASVLAESRETAIKSAEMMASAFGMAAETLLQSPLALIGTPDECIAELKRRAKEWSVSQFIFAGVGWDENVLGRWYKDVLAHV
jgi:alkanesulfonate monooxygenase SsuD/methylene tetrahydromethanopterin reductase-like flavin-dependent oxidoreductase (luciferase family)